ncbi:hypothetical protein D918_10081 [Trichuris suis]|nr:hypothetical protein D918_10081 [Trichuris suis]
MARVAAFKVHLTSPHQYKVEPTVTLTTPVNGVKIEFEVDSGSALTLISEKTFCKLWKGRLPELRKSELEVKTWSRKPVTVLGSFQADVQYRQTKCTLELYVTRNGGRPLLGRSWFRPLNISLRLPTHQVSCSLLNPITPGGGGWRQIIANYAQVFQRGSGRYTGPPIQIELIPGAKPRFLKCRPVPFALMDRVKNEIERLDERGSLEPVRWSDWASPIVTVLKKGGEVRICGDYSATVNLVTRKDVYPIPTVAEVMTVLAGGHGFRNSTLLKRISN